MAVCCFTDVGASPLDTYSCQSVLGGAWILDIVVFGHHMVCDLGGGDKEDPKLGVYEGISVFLLGDETPMTEVYPGDNSLELKAKGKAVFTLDGDAIDCKWELDGTKLVIDIEGEECTGTLKGDVINLDFMGMIDMIFAKNGAYEFDASGKSEGGSKLGGLDAAETDSEEQGIAGYYKVDSMEQEGATLDLATLEEYGLADMIYLVLEEDGTGRTCFEEEAGITYDDTQIYAGEEGAPYTLDGELFQAQIVDSSNAYVWGDVLYIDLYLEDGAGGELTLNAGLRYLHEDWDCSTDYPALPEDAVAYYQSQGMDFLEMVEFYGLDTSDVPEWTDSFTEGAPVSSGGSPTANPGFSGPTAEYDYEEKGMILFDYPSDTFTFEKKFAVDTLKSSDGSLKITFAASWDMEAFGKVMEGYEKYAAESNGVIEDGLSYGGHEAYRCTWENVIGDVTMETYILFNESFGDYVGVNVIATAPSQSSLDANRDVIEAILHSVRTQ